MKVIVSRSGGITGARVAWEVRVDNQPDAGVDGDRVRSKSITA